MEDLRANYAALKRQAAEQEDKQTTQIRALELQLSAAQGKPPNTLSRDLQLLALASAKDAALAEVAGQRRRIETLENGRQTLSDRLERERADRAFEADRLQTKLRKFRKQRNQLRDQQVKARADLAAAMGARSRALSDAAELRKLSASRQLDPMRANVARLEQRVSDLQRSSLQAQRECGTLRRERDVAKAHSDQVQQRLATVASALGQLPDQPVPSKRSRSASAAGGSDGAEVVRPRKSPRIAATPREESKTEDDTVESRSHHDQEHDDQESDAGSDQNCASDAAEEEDGSDDDAIRMALTRSRSDVRRSSIDAPGSAESPIPLEASGGSNDASEHEWSPGDRDTSSLPAGNVPRGPVTFSCIPGFDQTRVFRAGEIAPWISSEISGLSVIGLTVDILAKRRLHRPGFHFGVRRKPPPASEYKASLITGAMVEDLLATEPWEVLNANVPSLTFDPNLSMRDLAEAYKRFEDSYRQTYWESTHYLPITGAMRQADPTLDAYCGERKQRRSHAGSRWKKILAMILRLMKEHHCDLDLLLDPFFLQFPTLGESGFWYPGLEAGADPGNLIAALAISDAADPWRNHHRDAPADHPSMDILRLEDKFVPKPL
ncbi:hypothetical protein BBJ28_00026890, partial [Nothophytophthora sp. Chile5]